MYDPVSKHFLFITPFYVPFVGGTTAFVEAIARRLVASGHRVTVLTTNARRVSDFWRVPASPEPTLPKRELCEGVEVERLTIGYPWPAPYSFGLLRRAGLWLRRTGLLAAVQRPLVRRLAACMPPLPDLDAALDRLAPDADIIHAVESSWDGLFTAAAGTARRNAIPFVAMPLMHLGDAGVRAHFQMVHQVDAYRDADAMLALSRREADAYVALGVASERVHIIPMGVELDASVAQEPTRRPVFARCTELLVHS